MNDYSKYDDNDLVVLLKEKKPVSEQAFEVIWNRYSQKLMQYCVLTSKNNENSEDLFQNTWIKFYEMATNEKKIQSIKYYLFKIAYSIHLKKIEQDKLKVVYIDSFKLDDFSDDNKNLLENLEFQEVLSQFNLVINYLDSKSKECLLLHWVGGLSFKEIAKLLDDNYDSVRIRCTRAMQKVLTLLEPNFNTNIKKGKNE